MKYTKICKHCKKSFDKPPKMELSRWFGRPDKPNGRTFCSVKCYKESLKYTINSHYKHGQTNSRLYSIWDGMKQRCNNINHPSFKHYGARGIKVCDEWNYNYQSFSNWSKNYGYTNKLTIDRTDNEKGYCPNNCRWATRMEQSNNTRRNNLYNAFGESKTLREWSQDKRCNTSFAGLVHRFKNNWPREKAITIPKYARCH